MLATVTNSIVVNCNYRLCPEAKFPIPVYDSYAIVKHVVNLCEYIGIHRDKIVLCGESGGATIVMAVAQMMVVRLESKLV